MKAPSGDLTFYAALLLGGAVYFAAGFSTRAVEYQAISVVLAACLAVEGVLLLVRFRWSPEVYVAIVLFFLGWGVLGGVTDGFNRNEIGLTAGMVVGLFGYPVLRGEVRGLATPGDERPE